MQHYEGLPEERPVWSTRNERSEFPTPDAEVDSIAPEALKESIAVGRVHFSDAAELAADGTYTEAIGNLEEKMDALTMDEDEFVDPVPSDVPARPANYEEVIATNPGREDRTGEEVFEQGLGPNNCATSSDAMTGDETTEDREFTVEPLVTFGELFPRGVWRYAAGRSSAWAPPSSTSAPRFRQARARSSNPRRRTAPTCRGSTARSTSRRATGGSRSR